MNWSRIAKYIGLVLVGCFVAAPMMIQRPELIVPLGAVGIVMILGGAMLNRNAFPFSRRSDSCNDAHSHSSR